MTDEKRPRTHRFKLADAREFLPGGALSKYLVASARAGELFSVSGSYTEAEVNALFVALGAPLSAPLPVESDPEGAGPSTFLGELLRVELRGPELWGEARFPGWTDGSVPLRIAAHGLTVAFRLDARDDSGAHLGPRLTSVFPASGPRDPALYPGTYEESPADRFARLAADASRLDAEVSSDELLRAGWVLQTQGYVRGPWRIYQATTWCVGVRGGDGVARLVSRGHEDERAAAAWVESLAVAGEEEPRGSSGRKRYGVFEVAAAWSSHLVMLHAVDDAAIEQEWAWAKVAGPERGRGRGDPRSPRVVVLPEADALRFLAADGLRLFAEGKAAGLAEELRVSLAREAGLRADLATVKTDVEGVWYWMGDGGDHPASLTCPVVMSAERLRKLVSIPPVVREAVEAERRPLALGPAAVTRAVNDLVDRVIAILDASDATAKGER